MSTRIHLYALCGSQRQASTSRALLVALRDAAPPHIIIEICDLIGELPIFNPDREGEHTPAMVSAFAERVRVADGLIVSCPEYVHSIPGGFKNALDWLVSRDEVPFKPVMLAHASHRGDDVLDQLREVLTTMSLRLAPDAFLRLPLAGKTSDAQRDLLREARQDGRLQAALEAFAGVIAPGEHPCGQQLSGVVKPYP